MLGKECCCQRQICLARRLGGVSFRCMNWWGGIEPHYRLRMGKDLWRDSAELREVTEGCWVFHSDRAHSTFADGLSNGRIWIFSNLSDISRTSLTVSSKTICLFLLNHCHYPYKLLSLIFLRDEQFWRRTLEQMIHGVNNPGLPKAADPSIHLWGLLPFKKLFYLSWHAQWQRAVRISWFFGGRKIHCNSSMHKSRCFLEADL